MKAAREHAGLSQIDAAMELGVTKGALSAWENDKYFPQLQAFVSLCKLYGASADELLFASTGDRSMRVHEGPEPYGAGLDPQLLERIRRLSPRQQRGLLELLSGE
ncbi:XRE family transcriptional regulator [Pseudoxanthomonas sp. SGD-10]|nr:XRE family transcriptional regulator [Pseudoxanthomonas sp. SGD-10]